MPLHETSFQYLRPSPEQIIVMGDVRKAYEVLYAAIDELVPEGRYKSLAITELEASAMFANKGIVRYSDGEPREGAVV